MRNPVAKHFRKVCRPSIQQSKRRQALMAASVQDEDEHDFNTAFSQRNTAFVLDSEDGLWDDVLSDVSCSSISVNDGDEE